MNGNLAEWTGVRRAEATTLDGAYARLEPLDPQRHGNDLYCSAREDGAENRFRYLFESVPPDRPSFDRWLEGAAASPDPLFFAVVDKGSGRAEGRQALMRMDPAHGVIEIGNILWGPAVAGTRVATEALFLVASHVFDTLGYRRFEWKCNDRNAPSRKAAARFGFVFEGVFRNHMVVKGENRDTAWFSITDREWPALRDAFRAWLDPSNFDAAGRQQRKLEALRASP